MVGSHESSLDCISDGRSCHALWPSRFLQELDMKREQFFMQAVAKRLGIPHDMAWWAVGCYSIFSSMFTCLWLSHASDIQVQLFVRWWFQIWVHYFSFLRSWPNWHINSTSGCLPVIARPRPQSCLFWMLLVLTAWLNVWHVLCDLRFIFLLPLRCLAMSCRRFAIFKVDQQLKAQEMSVDQQENFRWAGGQPLTCFKFQYGSI